MILIPLFEQFPLNTIKHLGYLVFKNIKCIFFLDYLNRKSSELNKPGFYSEILELKINMNIYNLELKIIRIM